MHRSIARNLSRLLLLVATLAAGNVLAQKTGATPLIWEVRSAGNAVYLLGSIHLGRSDMYPMGPAVEKAYRASKIVALEADPTDQQAVMAAISGSLYQPPETLQKNLPGPLLAGLSTTLERYGIPLEQVQRVFPSAERLGRLDATRKATEVLDAAGKLLGYVFTTSPEADDLVGYSGPSNLIVGISSQGELFSRFD